MARPASDQSVERAVLPGVTPPTGSCRGRGPGVTPPAGSCWEGGLSAGRGACCRLPVCAAELDGLASLERGAPRLESGPGGGRGASGPGGGRGGAAAPPRGDLDARFMGRSSLEGGALIPAFAIEHEHSTFTSSVFLNSSLEEE